MSQTLELVKCINCGQPIQFIGGRWEHENSMWCDPSGSKNYNVASPNYQSTAKPIGIGPDNRPVYMTKMIQAEETEVRRAQRRAFHEGMMAAVDALMKYGTISSALNPYDPPSEEEPR